MRRLGLGALAVLWLAGCAARQAPPPPAPISGPLPSAAELLDAVAARRSAIVSLRSMARLRYTSPEETRSAKQVIAAARPDRLRFEVLSPFGSVFVLTTDHGGLAAYVRDESTFYRGSASAENLYRYTQVDLPVGAAVDLLLGTPPIPAVRDGVVSRDEGLIKLWQDSGDTTHETWFSSALLPVRYEWHDRDGYLHLRASFDDYREVDHINLPMRLTLEQPDLQRSIEIDLRDPEVNPPLANAVFALQAPPGSRIVDLDRGQP
jgi:outer membrane biogenesis lipoprotein LolB